MVQSSGNSSGNSGGHQNGVADYFAILGTGETLQLKATQKKLSRHREQLQQQQLQRRHNPNQDSDDIDVDLDVDVDVDEELKAEEECAMMERFYREIVQLCIVSVYSNAHGDHVAAHLSQSASVHAKARAVRGGGSGIGGFHGDNGHDNGSDNGHDDDDGSSLRKTFDHGAADGDNDGEEVTTPLISLRKQASRASPEILHQHPAGSAKTGPRASSAGKHQANAAKIPVSESLPREICGFHILHETIPANPPNCNNHNSSLNNSALNSTCSTVHHQDLSISINSTFESKGTTAQVPYIASSSDRRPHHDHAAHLSIDQLWRQGQTFHANVHPAFGYRQHLLANLKTSGYEFTFDGQHQHDPYSHNGLSTAQSYDQETSFLSMPSQSFDTHFTSATQSPSQSQSQPQSQSQSQPNNHDTLKDGNREGSPKPTKRKSRFLKRMRDNVQVHVPSIQLSKIKQRIQDNVHVPPILANKAKAAVHTIHNIKSFRDDGSPVMDHQDPNANGDANSKRRGFNANANANANDGERIEAAGEEWDDVDVSKTQFYIGYRRRGPDEVHKPSIADCAIRFCRIHRRSIISPSTLASGKGNDSNGTTGTNQNGDIESASCTHHLMNASNGMGMRQEYSIDHQNPMEHANTPRNNFHYHDNDHDNASLASSQELNEYGTPAPHKPQYDTVRLNQFLPLPPEFDEWVIPEMYQKIQLPIPPSPPRMKHGRGAGGARHGTSRTRSRSPDKLSVKRGFHSPPSSSPLFPANSGGGANSFPFEDDANLSFSVHATSMAQDEADALMPRLVDGELSAGLYNQVAGGGDYEYVPVIAVRRQRVGDEERFHEDPGIVDVALTFGGLDGSHVIMPFEEIDEFEEQEEEDPILGMSKWDAQFGCRETNETQRDHEHDEFNQDLTDDFDKIPGRDDHDFMAFGLPALVCKRNMPLGFLDTPFATRVLDRFPKKDYKGVPLPEEELPMFCYPTGCKLFRAPYQDAPLPEYYGFVVKNERGDSIHVSCVSFMEPLERSKLDQLNSMSHARRRTSLPHKLYCERQKAEKDDKLLMGFDEMMTFEYKTICLISRYPFWSAFRRFLSHLHVLSGSSSDLPLERYISHLLLTVPVPKPGGQCILIPLPAIASPMVLALPPIKDLPLLDLSFRRLFACLDVPTVVTIVLGFLALERKVIIMSSYPSLVSDVCELLRSLLFPFDLCAPYVPRLTEPFMSCLNFPGAIFAGIHDDGSSEGLAFSVRQNIPEDTFIVDLDTGDIDCNGERFEILKDCWEIIPNQFRSTLVEEVETLCQDAKLYPGQEPTGHEIEAALDVADVSFTPIFDEDAKSLDDRAIRDAFLRFFCSLLGGYERFLLVPDIDFLVSGAEWFDEKGFIASTEKQSRAAFLQSFVSTQLFQSFIQRRTEASDVQCLLFDECLNEFHSTQEPYGRLAESNELSSTGDKSIYPPYELLVDQCSADLCNITEVDETSSSETSLTQHTSEGFMLNSNGDLVTAPLKRNLPPGHRYVYYIDGHPHFPQELDAEMFYPKEPENLSAEFDKIPVPILTRSDREIDVSNRRRNLAVSHRGIQRQRRCLFQLPKLMASHFFNTWLMCIPSQVSQKFQDPDQHATYLLRALGALRMLRSTHRIVPDEAGYRCLIIACGRADSDRRQEVVKLFGLLRSDGIFPSAVTLGQYTRAIAEGYSKQSSGKAHSIITESVVASTFGPNADNSMENIADLHIPNALDFLDGNVMDLDDAGTRWRQGREARKKEKKTDNHEHSAEKNQRAKRRQHRPWIPVLSSSSFSPHWKPKNALDASFDLIRDFSFIALWSRSTSCPKCAHVLLDEEIQAGWDNVELENDDSSEIKCPCCGTTVLPKIGYLEMLPHTPEVVKRTNEHHASNELPAQVQNILPSDSEELNDERLGSVPYLSPSQMRAKLEHIIEDFGEDVLEREKLRYLNPTVFFNLWWFCCRFSLPLPLSISNGGQFVTSDNGVPIYNNHCCAFASWDKSIAVAACHSAAKTVLSFQNMIRKSNRPKAAPAFKHLVNSFQKSHPEEMSQTESSESGDLSGLQNPLKDDFPLLANLNFQSLGQRDWDNADLSAVLVKLVEACDKRDFFPAVEAVLQCNNDRRAKYGVSADRNVELDCYSTLLYLTRYQCTSAFHKFFPTTSKTCKGYHFWCPNSTVSIFDRMFRDALDRVRAQGNITPINDVSDIALGFRSVFGHII